MSVPDGSARRYPDWPYLKPDFDAPDPIDSPGFETILEHLGEQRQDYHGAASPPIFQNSTFIYPDAEAFAHRLTQRRARYEYSRGANPTVQILEAKLARLERGAWADCFATGAGAIAAAINTCLDGPCHVVCVSSVYGPTRRYLGHLERFGVTTSFVDGVDPQAYIAAIRPETRLVYLESPTSGRFECPDIAPIVSAARERGIRTIHDNSWASPYFFNPLELGVDMVVHSATKHLNGHSDVVAGVVAGRDPELRRQLWVELELGGAALDPFAGWLMIRGLRTLALRMEQHQRSGLALAHFLESHPRVLRVSHPGLESHPDHAVARRQFRGYSGLFNFSLREQSKDATFRVLDRLRLFRPGVSWGGYESLAIGGTFFSKPGGPSEWLIRLHCGLESTDDLVRDVKQALEG